ncbi:MAG: SH3 domain-containing protein, partial [Pyrinomonadaceae bacterium]
EVKRKVKIIGFSLAVPSTIIMKIISVLLLVFAVMLCLPCLAFAQDNRWELLSVDVNGGRLYLDKSSSKIIGSRVRIWDKRVFRDGSYRITLTEWKCSEKKYFLVDVTLYNEAGSAVGKDKGKDWAFVIPESGSEAMYKAVCTTSSEKKSKTESTSKKMAEIIVEKANIRNEPNINSQVIQQVRTGERFILAEEEPSGGWYQIILAGTNETAWIHGNNIKLVEVSNKSNIKKQKANRKIKKQKSN